MVEINILIYAIFYAFFGSGDKPIFSEFLAVGKKLSVFHEVHEMYAFTYGLIDQITKHSTWKVVKSLTILSAELHSKK